MLVATWVIIILGALGYADDIVLIAPSPSATCKLLARVMGMPVIMILFSMLINRSLLFLLVLTGVFWSRQ